jgi:hypothetical protein
MAKPSKEGLIAGTVAIVAVAGLGAAVKVQSDRDAKKSTPSPAPSATAKRWAGRGRVDTLPQLLYYKCITGNTDQGE